MFSKTIRLILSLMLMVSLSPKVQADAMIKPQVVSFIITPDTIDISSPDSAVNFSLKVESPTGIYEQQVLVTITDGANISIAFPIKRTDNPIDFSRTSVEFSGTYKWTSTNPAGVYTASASPVTSINPQGGKGLPTEQIYATSTSTLQGAKNSLLVRNSGYLNFAYPTFVGPTFNKYKSISYNDQIFNSVSDPIWKVGEILDPSKYYEIRVNTVTLKTKTNTPLICSSDGSKIIFLKVGLCDYVVYTDATKDFQSKSDYQVANITTARTKPTLNVGTIATQDSAKLPLNIAGPFVYSPLGLINPTTSTPSICYPVGTYITVISGGTCVLDYSTPESADYLASDVAQLKFEITRTSQTLSFTLPQTITLETKSYSLSATASSGQVVTYSSSTPATCLFNDSTLNLLKAGLCTITATQAGTTTIAPVSVTQSVTITHPASVTKKMICLLGKKTMVVLSKTCPKGYKPKK